MAKQLTKRQQEILTFIQRTLRSQGYPPTRAEIAEHFGFRSANAAEDHLRALERKGAVVLQGGVSRGIRLAGDLAGRSRMPVGVADDRGDYQLPLVGRVAAGSPILAEENIEDQVALDARLFQPRADYLLRVHGMSMRDIGIVDGDLLAVHRTPDARHRQIVVARIDDEVTVKRLERKGRRIRLLPENPDFDPIDINPREQSLAIEGLGVGVLRTLK